MNAIWIAKDIHMYLIYLGPPLPVDTGEAGDPSPQHHNTATHHRLLKLLQLTVWHAKLNATSGIIVLRYLDL